jgi:hypothetical protein
LQKIHVSPSTNGLVCADYHNLTLQPEDIWLAILCQTGFSINAHAEILRHLFVSHGGSKELTVVSTGNLNDADFGFLARCITSNIQQNIVDPDLRAKITPSFRTTTETDRVV